MIKSAQAEDYKMRMARKKLPLALRYDAARHPSASTIRWRHVLSQERAWQFIEGLKQPDPE